MGKQSLDYTLMETTQSNYELFKDKDTCDKYDYLTGVACGAIGGIVDIFFVGTPANSKLKGLANDQVDGAVKKFAKLVGWNPREGNEKEVSSAIGYLEKKFKVNYDQRHTADVNGAFKMSTKNHHMKSLAHSPDIVGLFFSVLNQFTSTASFIDDGKLVTIQTETFELKGNNLISKIFCGVANWFGHIMSDIAGSSGARGNDGRGSGVVMPFYSLFQKCTFGRFSVEQDKQDLATIATRAFQEGYDFRFGLATAVPVIITDLSIRLVWALRRRFQYGKSIRECLPTNKNDSLRVMLLFGNGTLCVMDGIDAAVRAKGNFLSFFMRLNLIAWFRLVMMVFKELCIRFGLTNPSIEKNLEAYKKINEAMYFYLSELEKIDIQQFKQETEAYNHMIALFSETTTESELTIILNSTFEQMGIDKPWVGDFDEHMANKNGTLVFK